MTDREMLQKLLEEIDELEVRLQAYYKASTRLQSAAALKDLKQHQWRLINGAKKIKNLLK